MIRPDLETTIVSLIITAGAFGRLLASRNAALNSLVGGSWAAVSLVGDVHIGSELVETLFHVDQFTGLSCSLAHASVKVVTLPDLVISTCGTWDALCELDTHDDVG